VHAASEYSFAYTLTIGSVTIREPLDRLDRATVWYHLSRYDESLRIRLPEACR